MKNKKILLITLLMVGIFAISGCVFKEQPRQSALDFKAEYERLNGKEAKAGMNWKSLSISEYNPYVKTTDDEIAKKIQNGETFYLYVGDDQCPWCRSGIEKMIEVANNKNIKNIYYIDFWDDNHQEILRDLYDVELDKKGNPIITKTREMNPGYQVLYEAVKDVIQDYTVTKDGHDYNVGVKKVYGGDHFYFENGKVKKYVSLRSDKLANAFDELSDEVLKDQEDKFTEFFN